MPRPTTKVDLLSKVLEMASVKLTVALKIVQPTTLLRIRQAVQRHPDLKDLLGPVHDEMKEIENALLSAKAEVRTAISMVWKNVDR
jgi:hypothetical protein